MKMEKLPIRQNDETVNLATLDKHIVSKKTTFKEPDKDSLREDSLNRYIEAARIKPLNEFLNCDH
jgi:hypothetical protein